jgi:hypothetical protein
MREKKEDNTALWIDAIAKLLKEKEASIVSGNMCCAIFIHKVSRKCEPQLCAHSLIVCQNTKKRPPRIAYKAGVFGGEGDRPNQIVKENAK